MVGISAEDDLASAVADEEGKGHGRHRNQERRDAIRSAINRYGNAWRNQLSDIFQELDSKDVPMGNSYGKEIDLGDGKTQKVSRWGDFDLADGGQRKQIIDLLRKYVD